MRKTVFIFIAIFSLFIISACKKTILTTGTTGTTATTTGTVPDDTTPATYKDGTYTGEGNKRQYGYEDAIVVITGGKITSITLRRLSADGNEVDYSQWTGATGGRPNLAQFRLDMAQRMVDKQDPNVDQIAGATDSCIGWIEAVNRALEKASA